MNVENYLVDVLDLPQIDLDHAREQAHEHETSLEHELHKMGLISHSEYSQLLAHTQGITFVTLTSKHVSPEHFTKLAEPLSRTLRSVVFNVENGVAQVATESLTDDLQAELSLHLDRFDLFLTDEASISRILGLYQTYLREHYGERIANHARKLQSFDSYEYEGDALPTRYISELQDSFDAIKITELLFSVMRTMQASDIYVDRGLSNTEVSMRFGVRILPTINLDVHIFDRLLWVYAKQADIDLASIEGPLHTVHLPTPHHSDLHARITFVITNANVSHIHINAENTAQLFPTIESLLPSQRQSQALIHQLSTGSLMITSQDQYYGKRLYYSSLERMSRMSKRVTSLEQHVDVNIPEVMQLAVNKKQKINRVISSAEVLRSNVICFSEQLKDQESYKHVTGRRDYAHVFTFETIRNAAKVISAFPYSAPVGLLAQHLFPKYSDVNMRKLSSEHKIIIEKALAESIHTVDLNGEFSYILDKKETKQKSDDIVSMQGFISVLPQAKPPLFEDIQRLVKASIVENALMRSSQGEIVVEDIIAFITAS